MLPIVAIVLVAVGGIAAMTHLGRPALMLNMLNNPTSSLTLEGASAGKGNVKVLTWAYAIIAIVAVMVSRYGFYMASII